MSRSGSRGATRAGVGGASGAGLGNGNVAWAGNKHTHENQTGGRREQRKVITTEEERHTQAQVHTLEGYTHMCKSLTAGKKRTH